MPPALAGTTSRQLWWLLATALIAALAGGCRAHSEHMLPVQRPLGSAPAGQARLVVVRPSGWAVRDGVTVTDERGHFLGDSLPNSHFTTDLPAGEHLIVAEAENTSVIVAHLYAGKTYVVELAMRAGAMRPRVELIARRLRSKDRRLASTWLMQTERLRANRRSGDRALRHAGADPKARIERARATLAQYHPATLAAHTLASGDGLVGAPFAPTTAASAGNRSAAVVAGGNAGKAAPAAPTASASAGAGIAETPPGAPAIGSPTAAAGSTAASAPTPEHPNRCQRHSDCPADRLCIGGSCSMTVACSGNDAECPHGAHCRAGYCRH